MKNRIFLNRISYFEAFLVFIAIFLASFFIVNNSKAATFNEPVDVNSSLGVDLTSYLQQGVQIGVISGQGGVLFANGTIINASEGVVPVTFGDDMRVDGELWRGPNKGISDNQALKVSDYLLPTMTNMNDIGAPYHRWKDIYYAGTMYGEDAIIGRELWGGSVKGIVNGDDPLFVSDSMYPTMDDINDLGSENHRWQDAYFSGDVVIGGDIDQDISHNGAVKALAYIDVNGTECDVERQFSVEGATITCTRLGIGLFHVDLGFQIDNRYFQITPLDELYPVSILTGYSAGNNNEVIVRFYSAFEVVGVPVGWRDSNFMIAVY